MPSTRAQPWRVMDAWMPVASAWWVRAPIRRTAPGRQAGWSAALVAGQNAGGTIGFGDPGPPAAA
ncbi:hypothetical protein [Amycolatopsis sp. RTGN1]|uniref:hypothetical protein n=1 Tax=Amycolatopsis ponsaeliensis TaxID=2992142 RepID=UPI00254EA070|nr:hypothetical protein [Amycolatopsis sp. RTGN1]